ncbi:C40 family peptidase [Lactobacillus crispatus]|nr:C40 family peptidase [Lactobacillus crispatus]
MKTINKSHNSIKLAFALVSGGLATQMVGTAIAHADTVTTVKQGETLKSIAKDNHITVKALAKANHLKTSDKLTSNQKINIPDPPKTHTVEQGESVSSVAQKYGLKTADVLKWNNLSWSNSTIYIGDKLNLQDPNQPQTNDTDTQNTNSTKTTATSLVGNTQAERIVNLALQYANQGIPYVWGGTTPSGFDCSGLVQYVFAQNGISLNRTTVGQEQNVATTDVSSVSDVVNNARPGDLLFWGQHGASYHVAIYIGNGQFVAAPQPGQNVDVENVSNYFMPSFIGRVAS